MYAMNNDLFNDNAQTVINRIFVGHHITRQLAGE